VDSHLSVFRVMVMVMLGGRDRQPVFQAGNGALTNRSSKRREDFTRQRYHGLSLSLCFGSLALVLDHLPLIGRCDVF
jgi:hypothetical protein